MDEACVVPLTAAPRILIVRLSAIGDVVHGLPVLNALRAHFPSATLGWVVEGRAADLLRGHPALDHLIAVPRKWLKSPSAAWKLRSELRRHKFDVAIDVQGLMKSAVAARLSGAPRRIGFDGNDGRELSGWLNNTLVLPKHIHVVDRNLELLAPLGITSPRVEFRLPESGNDAATAERIIDELGLRAGFAIINPGAGWPSKRWPPERFGVVAKRMGDDRGLRSLVVWAGPEERAWALQIAQHAAPHARLAPPTSLTELIALARRARLFLSADTGPLHAAAAVDTPCVGLFGPMPRERNGPYGTAHIALQAVWLKGSSRERRTADASSMEAISIKAVERACSGILDRAAPAARSA